MECHHRAGVRGPLAAAADGAPAEFTARINDHPIALRLLAVRRERRFGSVRLHLSGAGKNAVLAAPVAPQMLFTNARAMTARQMASQALSVNGVPLGWALHWHWASRLAPELDIPAAACEWEGVQRRERPRYNRAWVGGTSAGVFGPATRAGTSGERDAPQVLHPLITDAAAHRARALAVLSDTGPQDWVTLSLPIYRRSLATPQDGEGGGEGSASGPLDIDASLIARPGTVVRYRADPAAPGVLGIVRECAIEWTALRLRQRITLETHPGL